MINIHNIVVCGGYEKPLNVCINHNGKIFNTLTGSNEKNV